MKALIIYATIYGSTETVSDWLAERFRLAGIETSVCSVSDAPATEDCDLVILGSGIYAHKFLPDMENYIKDNCDALKNQTTALFGVAMRTETFFKNGRAFGGEVMLERYGAMLGGSCIAGKIFGGEMIFDRLSESDREGLERFYTSIRLSETDKQKRREPRTLLNKKQCWDFAEYLISAVF